MLKSCKTGIFLILLSKVVVVVQFVPGSASHFCHYPVSSIGRKLIPQKNEEQPNMSFPVKLFQFLSICNSRSSGELVRQSSRGVESPAKFLLCCASPRFVCLVCGRGVRVKCFLQVSSQIHGRQQSQCLGFAWPFPKGGVPLDVTFLCPTGELQQQCPFSSSCPSQHS